MSFTDTEQYNDNDTIVLDPTYTQAVNNNKEFKTHRFKFTAQSVNDSNPAWVYFDLLPADVQFNITVPQNNGNNVFAVDGEIQKDLILYKGGTYTFSHTDNATHPLVFTPAEDTDYTVTQDGTNNIVLTIPTESNTTSMTYYCQTHDGMGGSIQVIEPAKTTYAYIDQDLLTHSLFIPNEGYLYEIGQIKMKFDSQGLANPQSAYIKNIEFTADGGLMHVVPHWQHINADTQRELSKALNNCIRDLPVHVHDGPQKSIEIHAVDDGNTTIKDPAGNIINGSSMSKLDGDWFMLLNLDQSNMWQFLGTFAHEYYHAYHLFISNWAPSWFAEGLATFFQEKYLREYLSLSHPAFVSRLTHIQEDLQLYLADLADKQNQTLTYDLLIDYPPNYNIRLYLVLLLGSIYNFNLKQEATYYVPYLSYGFQHKIAEYQWLHSRNAWHVILKDFWHGIQNESAFNARFSEIFGPVEKFAEIVNHHIYATDSMDSLNGTVVANMKELPLYPDRNLFGREAITALPFDFTTNSTESTVSVSLASDYHWFIIEYVHDPDSSINPHVSFRIINGEYTWFGSEVALTTSGTYTLPFPRRYALEVDHDLWTINSEVILTCNIQISNVNITFAGIQKDMPPTFLALESTNLDNMSSKHSYNLDANKEYTGSCSVNLKNHKISFWASFDDGGQEANANVAFTFSNTNGDNNVTFATKLTNGINHAYTSSAIDESITYTAFTAQITAQSSTSVTLKYIDVLSMDYEAQIWHTDANENGNALEVDHQKNIHCLLPGNSQKVSFTDGAKITFKAKKIDVDDPTSDLRFFIFFTSAYNTYKRPLLVDNYPDFFLPGQEFDSSQIDANYQDYTIDVAGYSKESVLGILPRNVAVKDIVFHARDETGTADIRVEAESSYYASKKLTITLTNFGTKATGTYIEIPYSIQKPMGICEIIPVTQNMEDSVQYQNIPAEKAIQSMNSNITYYPAGPNTDFYTNETYTSTTKVISGTTELYDSFTSTEFRIPQLILDRLDAGASVQIEWDVTPLTPGTYMFLADYSRVHTIASETGFTTELIDTYDAKSNNNFVFTVEEPAATTSATSTGQALGDPYVYPMRTSTPVKLPNRAAAYCLYVCDTTFINAEVRCATPEHQIRMLRFVEGLGRETKRVISDGYFFSKFFVYDGSRDAQLMVDLREKTMVAQGNHAFAINESTHPNGSKDWGGVARNVLIEWPVAQTVLRMTVSFYTNPHIENGVALSVESLPANATGLLVHNYKPKLMRLRSLTTMDAPKLLQRLRKSSNPLQTKDIKSRAEIWKTY